jgi:cytochrome b subunit of formate dehydrogenase
METQLRYERFPVSYRVEHWVLTISFFLLGLTGLVQKYPDLGVSSWLIGVMGGIETTRQIHHLSAIVMMLQTVYHIGVVGYRVFVLRGRMTMLPGKQDAINAIDLLKHNLGLSKKKAQQGRFTFEEKLEYWAVVWGTVIMGITGFMLWNPIATTSFLPGDIVPAAKAAHGNEALLAVLAIVIWHLWHVHVRHWNMSMFKGALTAEEMEDEHPAELARIRAGKGDEPPAREVVERRRRVYIPVFAVLTAVMLAGIAFFVGSETTAVTTLPPAEDVTVFVHLTPTPLPTALPTNTPAPTSTPGGELAPAAEPSWDTNISALMTNTCTACHSSSNTMGGLDLSSYQSTMAGGDSGAAIVPGEARTSLLFTRQASGKHPGQFSAADLAIVEHWIEIGAPEKTTTPAADEGSTWESAIAVLMRSKCVQCHSDKTALGGLDLSSYQAALKGGKGGVGIAPGDPDGSQLVIIQKAGGHPGQLTLEELELIIAWIKAGVPEK